MKKFMIGALVAATLIGAVALTSGTYATLTASDSVTNNFETGSVDINTEETFTPPSSWNGNGYTKKVTVKNIGKNDSLVRVAIVPRWVDENDNPWPGDTSIVTINFTNSNKWVKDSKGEYYYYNEAVKHGESTKEIIDSVSASIPDELKERYEGKKLIVDVKSEGVLAAPKDSTVDAKEAVYKSTWTGITDDNIINMLDTLSKIN